MVTPGIGVGVAGCMDFTVPVGCWLGCTCGCWAGGADGVWGDWGTAVGCAAVGVLDVGTAVDAVGDGVTDGVVEDARDEE
ncbi:hypothetical protein ACJ65_01430 [Kocuria rhizophila]|nr:hypothetical protein ACJ65_01430 [Kocuria rhizophila]